MQYYLNDKKLNKIEKQKAEKDGLKIFEELDDYALKGWLKFDKKGILIPFKDN
jgi:ferredoxin-nitrite reductase